MLTLQPEGQLQSEHGEETENTYYVCIFSILRIRIALLSPEMCKNHIF
jgi:hypothetical protein